MSIRKLITSLGLISAMAAAHAAPVVSSPSESGGDVASRLQAPLHSFRLK